jgi:hypothetical protein
MCYGNFSSLQRNGGMEGSLMQFINEEAPFGKKSWWGLNLQTLVVIAIEVNVKSTLLCRAFGIPIRLLSLS